MSQPEFRVRPVIRHIVTRYSPPCDGNASLETLGEFDSEQYAEIVAEALRHRTAPMEYVIVRNKLGHFAADVMYAYSEADVQNRLIEMAAQSGDERRCQVFSRVRDMRQPG